MKTTVAGIGSSGGLGTIGFYAVYDMSCATMVDWVTGGKMGMRTFQEYGHHERCVTHLAGHHPRHSLRWMNHLLTSLGEEN